MYDYFMSGGALKTTLNIPDDLIKKPMSLSKHKTKTETVVVALREYIRKKRIDKILANEGELEFDYAWEKSRHGR